MKTIQCPSCGAQATNLMNCDFCNSLFVRSSSLGYNPENVNNLFYFEGLANALEQNLMFQLNVKSIVNSDVTTTTIYLHKSDFLDGNDALLQCPDSNFIASCFNHVPKCPSIAVDFAPEQFSVEEFERLKRIDEIKLFSTYKSLSGENGYVMDFGNDSIGAAKIISKILVEIKNIGQGTPLFFITEPAFNKEDFKTWLESLEDQEVKSYIIKRSKAATDNSRCFVATATMGDNNHPIVIDLREFRDNWLLKRNWGIRFTEHYYKHGPKFSKVIKHSTLIRRFVYFMVIQPLWMITKRFK